MGTVAGPDGGAMQGLEELLPGYLCQDRDVRPAVRVAHAARLGDALRRELLGRADAAGVPVTAAERAGLRAGCLDGGHVRVWRCPVPLILLDSVYYPVGHVMPPDDPGSLVIWLRPSLERSYLYSVANLWPVVSSFGTSSNGTELARAVTVALTWVRRVNGLLPAAQAVA